MGFLAMLSFQHIKMSEGNLIDFIFYFLPTDLSVGKASGFRIWAWEQPSTLT